MTSTDQYLEASLEILIDELTADDELRDAFFRNPHRTLRLASDWGLPLSDSEVRLLRLHANKVWNAVAQSLGVLHESAA